MAGVVEDTQDCVLQSLLSLPDPGQFPPFRSVLILVRDLVLVPFPQNFEQDDQVDQGPQTQSLEISTLLKLWHITFVLPAPILARSISS